MVKLKKVASKLLTEETNHVGKWSCGHASRVRHGTQSILAREHVILQDKLSLGWFFTKSHLSRDILPCGCFYSKFILVSVQNPLGKRGKFPGTIHFQGIFWRGLSHAQQIPKIYKRHIYSKNITYDPGKLSFIYNFHYSWVTRGLWIIIFLKFLNCPNPRVMYYH